MCRKILARLLGVVRDRLAQRREALEFRLVAQLPEEGDAQASPVEVAAALEQMYFEQRACYRVHGGTQADARHGRPEAFHCDDVDAGKRRPLAQRDVGRGEAKMLPELCTVDHFSADRVRTSEQPPGVRKAARLQPRAPRGPRAALAVKGAGGRRPG